jgi:HlyD family secretion protein
MSLPGKILDSADRHNSEPLPLFRPEAIEAQQQKFYGEIVLIRPFSLMLLGWFAIGIAAAVVGFLLLGQYTERARVPGVVTVSPSAGPSSPASHLQAEFYVPGRWISRLHPGKQLALRCDSCSAQFASQTGTVQEISDAPLDPAELSRVDLDLTGPLYKVPVYKMKVSLPPQAAPFAQLNPSPQAGMRMEAEIPLGRKPLIRWFFERSGS